MKTVDYLKEIVGKVQEMADQKLTWRYDRAEGFERAASPIMTPNGVFDVQIWCNAERIWASVQVATFDEDEYGYKELVSVFDAMNTLNLHYGNNAVAILLNNGNGTFSIFLRSMINQTQGKDPDDIVQLAIAGIISSFIDILGDDPADALHNLLDLLGE